MVFCWAWGPLRHIKVVGKVELISVMSKIEPFQAVPLFAFKATGQIISTWLNSISPSLKIRRSVAISNRCLPRRKGALGLIGHFLTAMDDHGKEYLGLGSLKRGDLAKDQ